MEWHNDNYHFHPCSGRGGGGGGGGGGGSQSSISDAEFEFMLKLIRMIQQEQDIRTVSYTHLDVYKRQGECP